MNAGRLTFIPQGEYVDTVTYDRLDIVRYNGDSFLCKRLCVGITPADGEFWMQLTDIGSRLSALEARVSALESGA